MTELQPGDKVRLLDSCYTHDTVGAVYYVAKTLGGAALLTNRKDITVPFHTFEDNGDFCLCYSSNWFEPLPKEKKGFVSHIRKLDELKGAA
jgi:hypothetical protein